MSNRRANKISDSFKGTVTVPTHPDERQKAVRGYPNLATIRQGLLTILRRVLDFFGCQHDRTTFPQTPFRQPNGWVTRVVCLKCGREFRYDWDTMKRGEEIERHPVKRLL